MNFQWRIALRFVWIMPKGEKVAIREMRGLASWYLKGLPSSRIFKNEMSQMNTLEDLENILRQFMEVQR